jgi:hypothetical protein
MWEDPIVAEVHQARRDILARFDGDMNAYFRHLRAMEEEERRRGRQIISTPVGPLVAAEPSRRKAG